MTPGPSGPASPADASGAVADAVGLFARRALMGRALADLAGGALPLAATTIGTWWFLDLRTSYLTAGAAGYVLLAALVLMGLRVPPPAPGLGWPNRITLVRTTLVVPVAALVATPTALAPAQAWWAVGLSSAALALDGLDGMVARRTDQATAFGARFDMEVDAFLLLVLSVLAWTSTELGAWVVGIGALRYLFVAAGWIWPQLDAPLPPSFRRKAVCVVQGIGLLVCLAPLGVPHLQVASAALALTLLVYSFGMDVAWLVRNRPPALT